MPNSGKGQGGAWVPGMSMPPLGFGVVPQQPGGMMTMSAPVCGQQVVPQGSHMPNWHQQQFMPAKSVAISSTVGVQPLTRQQQQQHFNQQVQYQQHLQQQQHLHQQQWVEAQKKAVEEQKKLFDQMMKQRHFDEQKMRLKAFDSSKKVGVSADSMIENILGTKDVPKMRSPQPPKKGTSTLPAGSGQARLTSHGSDTTSDASFSGPVLDLASQMTLGRLDNCQGGHPRLPSGPLGSSGSSVAITKNNDSKAVQLPGWLSDSNSMPAVYQQAGSLVEGKGGWVDTSRAYMLLMKTGLPPPYLGVLWEMVNRTRPGQLLGQEFTALLALVALVQSGQTITNREVLGTLKEPILPIIDHPALLPLVQDYLKQKQQQQAQSENKENKVSGVNPLLSNEQTSSISNDDDFDDFVSGPSQSAAAHSAQCTSLASQQMQGTAGQTPQAKLAMPVAGPSRPGGTSHHSQKPSIPSVDKIKRMNLPKVGFSPELSPSTSFDHTCDDEFDDFQSAAVSSVASLSTRMGHTGQSIFPVAHSQSSQNVTTASSVECSQDAPDLLQPEKTGLSEDKYAVFRDLEAPSEEASGLNMSQSIPHSAETNLADESFGDFCSSEPVSLTISHSSFPPIPTVTNAGPGTNNTSPVSFEVYSTPPEMIPESNIDNYFEADFGGAFAASTRADNYADIHEAMKRAEAEQKEEMNDWSDPFGEFEEASSMPISSTSTGSLPVPQQSIGVCDEEDEDFGDFMGPHTGGVESVGVSGTHSFPSLAENLGETQSVASLELPGLEMTVGLQASETHGSGSNQSPDLSMQPRGDIGAVEDQLRNLSFESSAVFGETSGSGVKPSGTSSALESFGSGLVDKYSIIREEASKNSHDEAHTGSWQRCLECSVQLLKQARDTLSSLTQAKFKEKVLSTSQMQEYLANLQEVWHVCKRISASSRQVTTSAKVDELLTEAKALWEDISTSTDNSIAKVDESHEGDNQMGENEVCGVCLAGGGSKLTYGGHVYHPSCANLWLNCVDLLLPSLTPVTLL